MILVVAGMGFIGVHVVKSLLDAGEDIVATYNHSWRVPEFWQDEVGKRVTLENLDVTNPYETVNLAMKHKVNGIVFLAAPGFGASSVSQDYAVNMGGLYNALEAARTAEVRRFTYVGSSTVYNGLTEGPYKEDAALPLESTNATETYKKAGEIVMLHFARRTGLDVVSVRPRQVYGPMYYSMVNLPSRLCHAAVKGTLPDYGPAGAPFAGDTGDFTSVKDVASVVTLVHQAERLNHKIYNVGGGRAFEMQELADAVMAAAPEARIELKPGTSPNGTPSNHYLDMTRVKEEFGFEPRFPIERGLPDYIQWLRSHPQ